MICVLQDFFAYSVARLFTNLDYLVVFHHCLHDLPVGGVLFDESQLPDKTAQKMLDEADSVGRSIECARVAGAGERSRLTSIQCWSILLGLPQGGIGWPVLLLTQGQNKSLSA